MIIGAYPSIYNLGHKAVAHLLDGPVIVEEKVDGSQFSFGIDEDGELNMRSKGAVVYKESPGMFKAAVETVVSLAEQGRLARGFIYRGEYLSKPKHNALAYTRVPKGHIIIFDVQGEGVDNFIPDKLTLASAAGFEVVPFLFSGMLSDRAMFDQFLARESVLGGQKIEGVVIKPANYDVFGIDKHVLMGKYVSEAFRETHSKEWKASNPGRTDAVERIIATLKTPQRWQKAVQHLREQGKIEDSPKDIGLLIKAAKEDIAKEETEWIKAQLYDYFKDHVTRGAVAGLAEWYKEQLLQRQFEHLPPVVQSTSTEEHRDNA